MYICMYVCTPSDGWMNNLSNSIYENNREMDKQRLGASGGMYVCMYVYMFVSLS